MPIDHIYQYYHGFVKYIQKVLFEDEGHSLTGKPAAKYAYQHLQSSVIIVVVVNYNSSSNTSMILIVISFLKQYY